VLFIDLDHFKRINDQHGHLAGDRVLQAVALCVQQHLRASDVFGRIGGEEFCVFLPHTDAAGAKQVAEDLRTHIEALMPEIARATHLRVTASIGVTSVGPEDESLQTIQHRADEAMYQAKQQGRNRVSVI
jgi:diguanylate cyclase (GGDEF)-like protein